MESVDLSIFLHWISSGCLSPNIPSPHTSEKSLSSATAFGFYAAHFMGAPVHVDK